MEKCCLNHSNHVYDIGCMTYSAWVRRLVCMRSVVWVCVVSIGRSPLSSLVQTSSSVIVEYVAVALLHKATCNNKGFCSAWGVLVVKQGVDEVRCNVLADLCKPVRCQTHHRHFFQCHYFTHSTSHRRRGRAEHRAVNKWLDNYTNKQKRWLFEREKRRKCIYFSDSCRKGCKGKFVHLSQEVRHRVCYPTQEVQRVGKRSSEPTREVSSRFQQLCEISTVACIYMFSI